jgi:hypothetical protein
METELKYLRQQVVRRVEELVGHPEDRYSWKNDTTSVPVAVTLFIAGVSFMIFLVATAGCSDIALKSARVGVTVDNIELKSGS